MQLSIFNLSPTAIFFFARFPSLCSQTTDRNFVTLAVLLVGSNGANQRFAYATKVANILAPQFALLVGSNGLEPSTSRLSGVCSNQLSYEPI